MINWTKEELESIDRKTRKQMTIYGMLHPRVDVQRLYLPNNASNVQFSMKGYVIPLIQEQKQKKKTTYQCQNSLKQSLLRFIRNRTGCAFNSDVVIQSSHYLISSNSFKMLSVNPKTELPLKSFFN